MIIKPKEFDKDFKLKICNGHYSHLFIKENTRLSRPKWFHIEPYSEYDDALHKITVLKYYNDHETDPYAQCIATYQYASICDRAGVVLQFNRYTFENVTSVDSLDYLFVIPNWIIWCFEAMMGVVYASEYEDYVVKALSFFVDDPSLIAALGSIYRLGGIERFQYTTDFIKNLTKLDFQEGEEKSWNRAN